MCVQISFEIIPAILCHEIDYGEPPEFSTSNGHVFNLSCISHWAPYGDSDNEQDVSQSDIFGAQEVIISLISLTKLNSLFFKNQTDEAAWFIIKIDIPPQSPKAKPTVGWDANPNHVN